MKVRKKPVVVDAEHFVMTEDMVTDFASGKQVMFMTYEVFHDEQGYHLLIQTLEGQMRASDGDWVITGITGEKYPCKDGIFKATYEPADGATF